jgi:hypothetical protein
MQVCTYRGREPAYHAPYMVLSTSDRYFVLFMVKLKSCWDRAAFGYKFVSMKRVPLERWLRQCAAESYCVPATEWRRYYW